MKPSLILSIFILIPNLIKTQLMIYTSSSSPGKEIEGGTASSDTARL